MIKAFHPIIGALFLFIVLCTGVSAKMPLGEKISSEQTTIQNKSSISTSFGSNFKVLMNGAEALQADVRHDYVDDSSNINVAWKFDFVGLSEKETPASSLSLPIAPTEVSSSAVSDSLIKVSWNAVSIAVSYRIYRDGKFLTASHTTHLSDLGLNGGTNHCYHVTFVDAAGKESERSKQTCAMTMKTLQAASGPIGLTATAASESQINLSWNPVNGALGYKVYRDGLYLMTSTTTTSVPDKGLRKAGRYCYQVTAVDTAGKESERSNQICAEGIEQKLAEQKIDTAASVSKEMLDKGRVQIDIEFDNNKYDVKPIYNEELKKIGDVMAANPELKMIIEGHTDNVGGTDYNMNLSARRAEAVRSYIINNFDIKETHLTSKGYGMSKPIASNKTAAGRQKNRRVEAAIEYVIKK